MNKRDMKKLIKRKLGSFLFLYGHGQTPWRDVPDLFGDIELFVFRGQEPTVAERRRLQEIYMELHENWRD